MTDHVTETAAATLADLSHRPVKEWTSKEFEQVRECLDTLRDAGHLSEGEAADLKQPFDQWEHSGLSEGLQAKAVHDLQKQAVPALPESLVAAVVGRAPEERDVSGSDPEWSASILANECRIPVELWDAANREMVGLCLATLADADVYPDHVAGLLGRLGKWREGDREDLLDDLREYTVEARECVRERADEQAGGWRSAYETTTYRGPDRYPVPEDWTLSVVEGDGIGWTRPPYPEEDAPREWSPEDRAGTLNDYDFERDEQTVKFDVNGTPVFTVTEPDRDDLMAAIAEVLARVARGEDYSSVTAPDDYGGEDGDNEDGEEPNASLGDFGGTA